MAHIFHQANIIVCYLGKYWTNNSMAWGPKRTCRKSWIFPYSNYGWCVWHMFSGTNQPNDFSWFLIYFDVFCTYPLVNVYKNYGTSHFFSVHQLFPWPFCIAMLNYERIYKLYITDLPTRRTHMTDITYTDVPYMFNLCFPIENYHMWSVIGLV